MRFGSLLLHIVREILAVYLGGWRPVVVGAEVPNHLLSQRACSQKKL